MSKIWLSQQLSELMRSYQGACIVLAAAELDLIGQLTAPQTAAELATQMECNLRGLTGLLDALAALGLVIKEQGRYRPADGVAARLTAQGPDSLLAMAQHQAHCLRSWAQLAPVVKSGKPAGKDASIRGADADYAAFIEAMDNIARTTAPDLVAKLPDLRFTHLLDVGGASGTWTIAFLKKYPDARATLFDLPKVMPQAAKRLAEADVISRVRLVGGDFMADALPGGADLAWLSAIIHQMSREDGRRLFASVFAALVPGGRILIRDHVMDESRTRPAAGAMFAINMLVNTQTGGTFTFEEIAHDLHAAGFIVPEIVRRDDTMNCVIRAVKPE